MSKRKKTALMLAVMGLGSFSPMANDGYLSVGAGLENAEAAKVSSVGEVTAFTTDSDPTGYLLCDGREVSRTEYAELFAKIGTKYGTGDGETTFNLPRLTDGRFIEGSTEAGEYKEAGLPNITGGVNKISSTEGAKGLSAEGAFDLDCYKNAQVSTADLGLSYYHGFKFDASRSNPTYGKSDTVQPESLTMRYFIKATKTADGGDGIIEAGNEDTISGDTAYKELRPTDGNYIKTDATTADNLTALDVQAKANEDAIAEEITNRTNADAELANRITEAEEQAKADATEKANRAKQEAINDAARKVSEAEARAMQDASEKASQAEANAKADTAQKVADAESRAKADAESKAKAAEEAAKADASQKVSEAETRAKEDASNKAKAAEDNAKADATEKANQAEANAKADATSKANAAESNAKSYTDLMMDAAKTYTKTYADEVAKSKANVGLDNINEDGKMVIRELAKKEISDSISSKIDGLDASGDTIVISKPMETKDIYVDGKIVTTGDVEIGGNLHSKGDALFDKNVYVRDNLVVGGDVYGNSFNVGNERYITSDGINANGHKIINVANGEVGPNSTDAVNGSQLFHAKEFLQHNMNQIGAGAAAMASLHPLDYEENDKLSISASMGNYKNKTAMAAGVFYRPNLKSMVNLSGTLGNSENMIGLGFSAKMGKVTETDNMTDEQLRDKVSEIHDENKELKEKNDKLQDEVGELKEENKTLKDAIDKANEQNANQEGLIATLNAKIDAMMAKLAELNFVSKN